MDRLAIFKRAKKNKERAKARCKQVFLPRKNAPKTSFILDTPTRVWYNIQYKEGRKARKSGTLWGVQKCRKRLILHQKRKNNHFLRLFKPKIFDF